MAVSIIRVNSNTLQSDASAVQANIRQIAQNATELAGLCATLNTMWEGPASTVFRVTFEKEIELLRKLSVQFNKLNEYEMEARSSYDNCEREVHEITSSLRW